MQKVNVYFFLCLVALFALLGMGWHLFASTSLEFKSEPIGAAFKPNTNNDLRSAVITCSRLSADCTDGPHGLIGDWDVSGVTDMRDVFSNANSFNSFNGDISKWDVSSVTNMGGMFSNAHSFNGYISKWNVSSVVTMDSVFWKATSFKHNLCGAAWIRSKASKRSMFGGGSSGAIQGLARQIALRRPLEAHLEQF